ncbi:MAG: succinate dehydrogenase/fumarate reductase iron-sulfur subunit [Opitutales bacterium]|nr:succinate dehydrogenase/fumarate reductase iron-sulfur subunit [Opitutales bacterium]MCH8539715.1 succinate dehydrogenase/fumarate reductase iron-sulfur subunit [Opitutales bacterium]
MNVTLKVWRQKNADEAGYFETLEARNLNPDMSFLEMLDVVNNELEADNKMPVAFDHDCREGICGTCSLTINGQPHGPGEGVASCQVYMRSFKDGDTITIEPFRAKPFPVIRDLVVDRTAFDKIIQSGGFVTVRTGSAPDANAIPIPKETADLAMDAAACIGCGACVAACKNASAMLFVAAKASQLNMLPQGKAEKDTRVLKMVATMDEAGFGNCTNQYECSAACPKLISEDFIGQMNRDYLFASLRQKFLRRKKNA